GSRGEPMSARSRRPSQADIAEVLGISVSTVSRALAEEGGISAAVRAEVQRTAEALGYRSKAVPGWRGAPRRAVALVPAIRTVAGLSGFYEDIVEGMRVEATEQGINLDVRMVRDSQGVLEQVQRHLKASDASSLLLAGIDPPEELVEWARAEGVRLVLVNG